MAGYHEGLLFKFVLVGLFAKRQGDPVAAWQRPSKFRYISLLELNRNSRLVIPALEQSSGARVKGDHLLP